MNDTIKLGLRLMLFALCSALLLALTNMITARPIEEQERQKALQSRKAALPAASEFTEINLAEEYGDAISAYPAVTSIMRGLDASGSTVGYIFTMSPYGYGGPIPITLGISDGAVTGIAFGTLAETPGLGSKVAGSAFTSQFTGLEASSAGSEKIDTISGATVSSSAVKGAVTQAIAVYENLIGAKEAE
ncbi:MAG: FMN-binding protein [Eubacteriales bacterium]|nr:FMN-binding protein [Eubacteriales bacterium]MDD3881602.1 FMN-binding protein [Eubacteriales bacterium]MDD4512339.1 FMN-binding protein [Eubacteriales bacterium]